jgi:hypothetical protein
MQVFIGIFNSVYSPLYILTWPLLLERQMWTDEEQKNNSPYHAICILKVDIPPVKKQSFCWIPTCLWRIQNPGVLQEHCSTYSQILHQWPGWMTLVSLSLYSWSWWKIILISAVQSLLVHELIPWSWMRYILNMYQKHHYHLLHDLHLPYFESSQMPRTWWVECCSHHYHLAQYLPHLQLGWYWRVKLGGCGGLGLKVNTVTYAKYDLTPPCCLDQLV